MSRPDPLQQLVEELQRLVGQVRAEVVPQAGAGAGAVAPAVGHLWAEAVEMGVHLAHLTQGAGVEQGAQGEEVGVPAAVVEHRQDATSAAGRLGHGLGLGDVEGEGLVHHHVLAGGQRGQRQRGVGVVGGGHHHQRRGLSAAAGRKRAFSDLGLPRDVQGAGSWAARNQRDRIGPQAEQNGSDQRPRPVDALVLFAQQRDIERVQPHPFGGYAHEAMFL